MMNRWLVIFALFVGTSLTWAQSPLEQKAQDIEKQLIAPCCWAKTVHQEQSQVAIEMKQEIRRRLAAGQPVEQIYDAFEKEFGERVLATPKTEGFNWTVWVFPIVMMLLGSLLLIWVIRRYVAKGKTSAMNTTDANGDGATNGTDQPLSEQDEAYRKKMDQELYRP